jgi:hypothetical protein
VTIEDDMAVLARYSTGATMTYHLTAYAPWEGYRVMFNGSRGRLELEVVESNFVSPGAAGELKGAALHGVQAAVEEGWATLTVRPYWEQPHQVPVPGYTRQGHGGADALMTARIFGTDNAGGEERACEPRSSGRASSAGGEERACEPRSSGRASSDARAGATDPLGRGATARDGALALLTGLAANRSFETREPVTVADLLTIA